jgi:putative FmdB family regulatory protein
MPIFEYSCRKCNHRFEIIVLSAREKIACPKCRSTGLEKELSTFSAPAAGEQTASSAGGCGCTPRTCGCH